MIVAMNAFRVNSACCRREQAGAVRSRWLPAFRFEPSDVHSAEVAFRRQPAPRSTLAMSELVSGSSWRPMGVTGVRRHRSFAYLRGLLQSGDPTFARSSLYPGVRRASAAGGEVVLMGSRGRLCVQSLASALASFFPLGGYSPRYRQRRSTQVAGRTVPRLPLRLPASPRAFNATRASCRQHRWRPPLMNFLAESLH